MTFDLQIFPVFTKLSTGTKIVSYTIPKNMYILTILAESHKYSGAEMFIYQCRRSKNLRVLFSMNSCDRGHSRRERFCRLRLTPTPLPSSLPLILLWSAHHHTVPLNCSPSHSPFKLPPGQAACDVNLNSLLHRSSFSHLEITLMRNPACPLDLWIISIDLRLFGSLCS